MSSKSWVLFDLNELPTENTDDDVCFEPESSSGAVKIDLDASSAESLGANSNRAFTCSSSASEVQPFLRSKSIKASESFASESSENLPSSLPTLSNVNNGNDAKSTPTLESGYTDNHAIEKEEGEWSDAEGSVDMLKKSVVGKDLGCIHDSDGLQNDGQETIDDKASVGNLESISVQCDSSTSRDDNHEVGVTLETNFQKYDSATDVLEDPAPVRSHREVKGVEASHALRIDNIGRRPKLDPKKEAMLGKKRARQTMYINLEDVKKHPVSLKTPKRQILAPTVNRTGKQTRSVLANSEPGDKQSPTVVKDTKQMEILSNEISGSVEPNNGKRETDDDYSSGSSGKQGKLNSSSDLQSEGRVLSFPRQNTLKQTPELKPFKDSQPSIRKGSISNQTSSDTRLAAKKLPSKKQNTANNQYQDSSVERLLREVTNEKFWQNPEREDLQPVPGKFDSVEEYISVFEPLLFEECRAQLYSTWEESLEASNYVRVGIKCIERRERGWFDVILIPPHEYKWSFKEGDVAVLSSPRPGTATGKRNSLFAPENEENSVSGRVAGTVRRHIPVDTRDHMGAILHFYVGDFDSNSKIDDDHILRKLHPGGVWYLTVLGSLATTQREYVALHAFPRLNLQMQNAILQPSPDQFPKYAEQTPAMPDCFTPNFVEHLHKTFNGPQLAAIKWAAMHTAAGTSNGATKMWPFTLVQGPPGTGKTHTVWGMLNVIHLVQYQHYYTALLKKLAPESYNHTSESNPDNVSIGSIDEVLQRMDQNLLRTLPKLCPKPRMLVCAPSNAATDELLARVLDRGFIDGEMMIYRPDVARVGVDSQTRAAQAVSVERRADQLLMKSREEVHGWMRDLRIRETQLSQQIRCLQRELSVVAATSRAQGSVGVDSNVTLTRDQNLRNLAAVVESRDKVLVEMSRLVILEGRFRAGSSFYLEEARANLEASFANEAEIVFTTVSSSGRKLFSRLSHGFDMVVIDEAAQASEVAVLPPLSLGAARCVLVGDPQQLPATVISKAAGTLLYSRSLFERFQQAGSPTMLLSVQYRMHPQIRDFPSRHFYQARLTDSESVANRPDELYYKDPLLRPYIFFDVSYGRESHRGGSVSYQNSQEAQFCVRLYEHLQATLKSMGVGKVSVGIITPYKLQLKCLQREFKDILSSDEGKDIYINTVDAFQGQERDVIIMSCVRASSHGVGFVADIRRMNVALTRAKRALWVMGNASALLQSDDWAALIDDSKTRNCYLDMDSLPKDFIPRSSTDNMFSSKVSSNKGLQSVSRYQSNDSHVESRSTTQSEEDEKSSMTSLFRNGNHWSSRKGAENSLHGIGQSNDRSRNARQHGFQKKQNAGVPGKRDS